MKITKNFIKLIKGFINKNKKEEIKPFIKEDIKNEDNKDGFFFVYGSYNNYNNYADIFNGDESIKAIELLKHDNLYSYKKQEILYKVFDDCLKLHGYLIPLVELNIVYSIDVVGGAIRDFLLNKEIKDLDILIEIDGKTTRSMNNYESQFYNNKYLTKEVVLEKNWCSEEELNRVSFSNKDQYWEKVNKLIKICLNKKLEIKYNELYSQSDRKIKTEYGGDILKELTGLIKLESKELNYPIEILLTDRDKYYFYENIDFDLCNVGMEIVTKNKETQEMKLNGYKDLINTCICKKGFIKDIVEKKMTFKYRSEMESQLQYSFTNHYPRLQKKFPEYKLDISKILPDIQEKINNLLLYKELGDNFKDNIKEEPTRSKKRKI